MVSKMQLDFDRNKISTGFYNGMVMPKCYEKAEEHLPKMKAMEIRDDDFLLCSFPKSVAYGGWFSYMDKVKAFQQANPDQPLLNISYEEMSLNPFDTVKRLAEFSEKPATPEFCAEVVEACSFKKGDMNDWKNYVTVALNEKFDEVLKDRADMCSFSAKYAKA